MYLGCMRTSAPAILTVGPNRLVSVEAVAAEFRVSVADAVVGLDVIGVRRVRFGPHEYVGLVELHRAITKALTGLDGQELSDYIVWAQEYYKHGRQRDLLASLRESARRFRAIKGRRGTPGGQQDGDGTGAPRV